MVGLATWGYVRFENRLTKQLEYYDLKLGMTKNDVTYVKGIPDYVQPDADKDGWQLVIQTKEIEKGKSIKDFDTWSYHVSEGERLDIDFDKSGRGIITIGCFAHRNGSCRPILGISTGRTEEEVIERFGQPDKEKVDGVTKNMVYTNLNLSMYLERKKVYMFKVGSNLKNE